MASKVEICNLALSILGIGKEIANIETEKSEEASACRRFYDIARDNILRAFAWPFTTKITTLALIEEDPNSEWDYSYRYPSDCLYIRRILSGIRNDTRQSRVPYKIAQDDSGLLVFTDAENAEMEYTVKADNPQFYPQDFTLALSYLLATLIAPRITAGDPHKLGEKALRLYDYTVNKAAGLNYSEEQADQPIEAESIRLRE